MLHGFTPPRSATLFDICVERGGFFATKPTVTVPPLLLFGAPSSPPPSAPPRPSPPATSPRHCTPRRTRSRKKGQPAHSGPTLPRWPTSGKFAASFRLYRSCSRRPADLQAKVGLWLPHRRSLAETTVPSQGLTARHAPGCCRADSSWRDPSRFTGRRGDGEMRERGSAFFDWRTNQKIFSRERD